MSLTIKQTRVVTVPVTELRAAIDTACVATLLDADGLVVGQSTTPSWLPQVLQIDLESGRIINWRAPSSEQLQAMADSQEVIPTMPADMVAALAHEFHQAGAAPEFANEQDMPYGYFDDERDPVLLAAANATLAPDLHPVTTTPEGQQHNSVIDIELPADFVVESVVAAEPVEKKPSFDIGVSFNKETGRWVADVGNDEFGEHSATSQQGKFEAIKNVLKKAGLHGVYEINQRDLMDDVEFYSYDGSRTLDADTVYVTKGADGWVAKTPSNRPVAGVIGINGELTALLKEMEDIKPEDAVIIETTDDEMRSKGKRRYAVTAKSEHVATQNDPVAAEEIGRFSPVKPRYQSPTTGETWTGRGKQPAWLQAAIADGANIDDFLIGAEQKPIAIPEPTPPAKPDTTPPSYDELVMAINHASTVNQAAALVGRISKHPNFSQQQSLYALQRKRVDALKSAEQST
jgi:DNA-binding protein H-NS